MLYLYYQVLMLSFIFACLALSFLIFIHELGHYLMAKKVKMKVEIFSIGFGRPIFSWKRGETRWQIGWLPFGGYIKIAGTDSEKTKDLYAVKDGFFGKTPWQRIQVAFMGPFVNLVFALMVFSLVWVNGGREKSFSEYTHKIGFVDPESALYQSGVRAGDEISTYDGVAYSASKDHLFYPLIAGKTIKVGGAKIDYFAHDKTAFEYETPISMSALGGGKIPSSGVLAPASFILYSPKGEVPLPKGSPMAESGIQKGDRLLWLDGHLLFSLPQLSSLINDEKVLVTVKRGDETLLRRIPRVRASELRLETREKEELVDWQYESGLQGAPFQDLWTLPYNLTNDGAVEERYRFIDKDIEPTLFVKVLDSALEEPLLVGDKIIAVAGVPVDRSFQILKNIQEKAVLLVIERGIAPPHLFAHEADRYFDSSIPVSDLQALMKGVGNKNGIASQGNLFLLKPVKPVPFQDFALDEEQKMLLQKEWQTARKEIESTEEGARRSQMLAWIDSRYHQKVLGLPDVVDLTVAYNPIPTEMYGTVLGEIRRTLGALVSGNLSPKWLSGPVGIVTVVQKQGMVSVNDALFWLGAISLNLGLLNLLPIPMLDGGTILFSLFEWATGKRLSPKTLERLILPFAILLILFFIFVTYHDITRIFKF